MVPQLGVEQALQALRARAAASSEQQRHARAAALEQSLRQQSPAGHTPSGPRRKGEGCDEEHQRIVAADHTPTGGACLRISLLAAGFVCGPSGISVRSIITTTGADIRSWSESWAGDAYGGRGACRVRTFVIEGKRREVIHAIGIISAAVERYAELCGGAYAGQAVDRAQVIDGVAFYYSPPPRAAVPYAASLRGHDKHPSPPARKSLGFASPRSPTGKENSSAGDSATPRGATPRGASGLRAHAAPFAGGLPATPPARHGVAPPHPALGLLPPLPEHMTLAEGQAEPSGGAAGSPLQCTPAYRTHAASAPAYSLFGGGGGLAASAGLLWPEEAPPTGGGASSLVSAFEQAATPFLHPAAPPTAAGVERSLFGGGADALLPAGTPGLPLEPLQRQLSGGGAAMQVDHSAGSMGALHRQHSAGSAQLAQDSLLAACGFPSFSAFAHQAQAYFQPSMPALFEPPQPAQPPVQPPAAAADAGGAAQWWQAPLWQEGVDAQMQQVQLPPGFGPF